MATGYTRSTKAVIRREFRFRNFHETMAFVNALAWIAHREDHHPDLDVGYNHCGIRYHTHAAGVSRTTISSVPPRSTHC